jgi:hypothetical protein
MTYEIKEQKSYVTITLPKESDVGDVLNIGSNNGDLWKICQNRGQQIQFGVAGKTTKGVKGYVLATDSRDCLLIVCCEKNKTWHHQTSIGEFEII